MRWKYSGEASSVPKPVIKNNRKMLTHRAYTSTKATTLAEIRPRRPFSAEIPEDVKSDEHMAASRARFCASSTGHLSNKNSNILFGLECT